MNIDFTENEMIVISYFIKEWHPDTDEDQQTKESILRKI